MAKSQGSPGPHLTPLPLRPWSPHLLSCTAGQASPGEASVQPSGRSRVASRSEHLPTCPREPQSPRRGAPWAASTGSSIPARPGTGPAHNMASSPLGVFSEGGWARGRAEAGAAAASLEVAAESPRGPSGRVDASEGPSVERAATWVGSVVDRLDTVRLPDEAAGPRAGVTGGGHGAPGGAGGGVEAPGGTEGLGESGGGWERPGSPRVDPSGPRAGELDAGAPEGRPGEACASEFAPKRRCRRGSVDRAGRAGGGPGLEVQLTGAVASPRGLRAALSRSTAPSL